AFFARRRLWATGAACGDRQLSPYGQAFEPFVHPRQGLMGGITWRKGWRVRNFWQDRRGGVAMIAAFALPAVVIAAVAAIEIYSLSSDRQKLQDVADATALNAAAQMRLAANDPVLERARSFAMANMVDLQAEPDTPVVEFLHQEGKPSGVKV